MPDSNEGRNHKKVLFRLEKDDDSYPPADSESLWAIEVGPNLHAIGNVPFFRCGRHSRVP